MNVTPEQINDVIADIYAAVGSPHRFTAVLSRIRTLMNGSSAMLFTPAHGPNDGGFGFVDHFDGELFRRYCEEYCERDPWAREAKRKNLLRTGVTATDEMLISQREMQDEPFFHDVQLPMDVVRVCCSVVTAGEEPSLPFTYLSIFRGAHSRPFGENERRTAQLLVPHVRQALCLTSRLNLSDANRFSAYETLNFLDCGVLLVEQGRNIVFMNLVAERLCTKENGLRVNLRLTGGSSLQACLGRDDIALQSAIDAALQVTRSRDSAVPLVRPCPVAVHGSKRGGPLLATALPLPSRVIQMGLSRPLAVVILENPAEKKRTGKHLFQILFQFTPAECRIAHALLTGEPPKTIAERLDVSENTVRTHIKSLYKKTDTRRMAALIGLLSRLADTRAALDTGPDSSAREQQPCDAAR